MHGFPDIVRAKGKSARHWGLAGNVATTSTGLRAVEGRDFPNENKADRNQAIAAVKRGHIANPSVEENPGDRRRHTMHNDDLHKPEAPLVSIGLPVYNGEDYLSDAIQSVLTQTYTNFELIVADNASTDSTPEIIAGFAAKDSRIRVFTQAENLGAAPNFNFCIDQAHGKYFKWLAHDDGCRPTYLEKCVAILESDPGAVLAHARPLCIDTDGNPAPAYDLETDFDDPSPAVRFDRNMDYGHACISVFGIIRLDILRKTPALASFVGSDRSLLAELALYGRTEYVEEQLFVWRDHRDRSVYLPRIKRVPWFDTSATGFSHILFLQHPWACAKAALRAPVPVLTRLRCLGMSLRWCWRNREKLAFDARLLGRMGFRKTKKWMPKPIRDSLRWLDAPQRPRG